MKDVEKLRLTFIHCLKLPQVAGRVKKTKVCWYINPDVEQAVKVRAIRGSYFRLNLCFQILGFRCHLIEMKQHLTKEKPLRRQA